MEETVIGIFDNEVEARQAVQQLYNSGFSTDQVEFRDSGSMSSGTDNDREGGVSGFFKNLFSRDEDNDKYVRVARLSESVVTVRARLAGEAENAAAILDRCGAVNVDERAGQDVENDTAYQDTLPAVVVETGAAELANIAQPIKTTRIPVLDAHLTMGEPVVLSDGTRLRSRIIRQPSKTHPGEAGERKAGDPLDNATLAAGDQAGNFTAQFFELRETKEVPVVTKEARVVEEIRVGKEVEVRTETIDDTIRKTEVDVEKITGGRRGGNGG